MVRKRLTLTLTAALSFLLVVSMMALYLRNLGSPPQLEEALRRECEDVLQQMTQTESCENKMRLYSRNLDKCRAVYDTAPKEDYNFRSQDDGTFFDRIFTNALCYARRGDIQAAEKVLLEVKASDTDIVSLGATGCEPRPFIEAFLSSLRFPVDSCAREGEIKSFFLRALQQSNFQDLIRYTKIGKPISIDFSGDLHFDCPSPFHVVQTQVTQLSQNRQWRVANEEDEEFSRKVFFQSPGEDRLVLFIRKENGCEYLNDISALMNSESAQKADP